MSYLVQYPIHYDPSDKTYDIRTLRPFGEEEMASVRAVLNNHKNYCILNTKTGEIEKKGDGFYYTLEG